MFRTVLLDPMGADRLEQMRAFLPDGWELTNATSRDPEDQIAALDGAQFAIVSDVPVTRKMMETPGLKAIHKWGVGYDAIDLDAARDNDVKVLRTTGSNAIAVAETTLGLILAVNRNIVRGHLEVHRNRWPKGELSVTSTTLTGQTVGIVGMGYIGKALAQLLRGFGCTVLYTKRTPLTAEEEAEAGVRFAPLDDLLSRADVVSLNCELNESTRNLIDSAKLALMKPSAILINVARGGVMVEADLADAIRRGRLRGAGVDVFSVEPIAQDSPLLDLERVILTPHIAAISADGFPTSMKRMFGNLQAVSLGKAPKEIDVLV